MPATCPPIEVPTMVVDGILYHISTNDIKFQLAGMYCRGINLELASLAEPDEYQALMALVGW